MKISILGDSISTYAGITPPDYRVYYSGSKLLENNLSSYSDTWWAQVIHSLHGTLCANNAYSGCKVSGGLYPSASSEERIARLGNCGDPDWILVYVGLNDFGYNVPVYKKHLFFAKPDPAYFFDAYRLMLKRIQHRYPHAKILCGTLLKTHIKGDHRWNFDIGFRTRYKLEDYNSAIMQACKKSKVTCVNLNENGCASYESLDGAHPTKAGHEQIAMCWIAALRNTIL